MQAVKASSSETLKRIMEAASDEFSVSGFDGARVDSIARRAGVNKAALYYHVGDKQALYLAVLEDVFSDISSGMPQALEHVQGPVDRLRAFLMTFAGTVAGRRNFSRIVLRELASGFENLPPSLIERMDRVYALLSGIVDEGRRTGVFRDGFNARLGFTMLIGSLHILNAGGHMESVHPGVFSYGIGLNAHDFSEVAEELCTSIMLAAGVEAHE